MPEKEWKDLHVAKSMKQLQDMAEKRNKDITESAQLKIRSLLKSLDTIQEKYEENYNEIKDAEVAYVYLFRYIELSIFILNKCSKGSDDMAYFKKYIGNKPQKYIAEIEFLKDLLSKRYEEKEKMRDGSVVKEENINAKDESKEIKQKRLKRSENTDSSKKEYYIEGCQQSLDCNALKKMIDSSSTTEVLIMDVRSASDFELSRIKYVNVMNVPSSIIKSGLSGNRVREMLSTSAKELWNKRLEFRYIVLVDDRFDQTPESSILKLKDIQVKWEYPNQFQHIPMFLEGGFDLWVDTFPDSTINPGMKKMPKISSLNFSSINDILYPDLNDDPVRVHKKPIVSLENSMENPSTLPLIPPAPSIPSIDRTTKPPVEKAVITQPTEQKTMTNKQFQNILDSQIDRTKSIDGKEKGLMNGHLSSDSGDEELTNRMYEPTATITSPVENDNRIMKKDNSSTKPNWKKDNLETSYETLKPEGNTNSSKLKRSLSSPNIAKVTDDEVSIEKMPPRFDRTTKPTFPNQTDSSHYTQEKHRATDGLDSAVMGANISRGLTGLKNLGNSCYMNSILQCVSNTTDLREELCKFHPADTYNRNINHKSKTEGIVAKEVEKVVRILWQGNIKYFSCVDLKTAVGKFRNSFRGYEQQDSHEFFTILMDWLHEDLNEPSPKGDLAGAMEETGEKAWGEFRKENNSIVLNLFYGQQKSTVRCITCGKESVTFEPFSNLSLLLPNEKDRCTLNECLELYMKRESINGWNCPNCKTARTATKKVDITRLPPVLVMHFKRFTSNGWCRKKQTFIDFPLEGLDMKKFSVRDSEQRNEMYNLYAVSNHYGTMESGHYTAYCHNTGLNRWFKFDDHEVVEIMPSLVKTPAAYILFYSAVKQQ